MDKGKLVCYNHTLAMLRRLRNTRLNKIEADE